jgi:hypothetical protein
MIDVVKALREKNQTVPTPLTLPEFEDIIDVEEAILLRLPEDYRKFLLKVSDVVFGSIEPATIVDMNSHTYLPDVTALAWEIGIPRDVLVICEDRGDYYCMDQNGRIGFWCEGEQTEQEWESIWQWAEEVWLNS